MWPIESATKLQLDHSTKPKLFPEVLGPQYKTYAFSSSSGPHI